ncbi:hypothetical protein NDU88_002530 [Pleurodeles waltl]|uniref:Uncharacterized protein n=1 Tax=Pleurodeles waltl TaxID=8319 RepID=A0AAV7NE12_PLEWA|nr:hypothetical protein NDU88_002530 [Pleurodeles waltl]
MQSWRHNTFEARTARFVDKHNRAVTLQVYVDPADAAYNGTDLVVQEYWEQPQMAEDKDPDLRTLLLEMKLGMEKFDSLMDHMYEHVHTHSEHIGELEQVTSDTKGASKSNSEKLQQMEKGVGSNKGKKKEVLNAKNGTTT